jgi:hypothetical protein
MRLFPIVLCGLALLTISGVASGQNWGLTVRDNGLNTPVDQANGISGGTAGLYAILDNFTGTPVSDDGTGQPAPATSLDFAGFAFTQNPGQDDLGSLFLPDPQIPGWPRVDGSADGVVSGTSGYVLLGTFDLSGLASGIYHEDITGQAYATDFNSTVAFSDLTGTLTLNVSASAATPEPGSGFVLAGVVSSMSLLFLHRRTMRRLKS